MIPKPNTIDELGHALVKLFEREPHVQPAQGRGGQASDD